MQIVVKEVTEESLMDVVVSIISNDIFGDELDLVHATIRIYNFLNLTPIINGP